jgi:hypothetical protein
MPGHWYIRDTGRRDRGGSAVLEVAHTTRPDVVALTDASNVGHAARVANVMNRLDGHTHAPEYDERGNIIER